MEGFSLAKGSDHIATLTPCKQKHPQKLLATYLLDSYFMLDFGSGNEANPSCAQGQFLADTQVGKLK